MDAWWDVLPPPASGPSFTRSFWRRASGSAPICSMRWWRFEAMFIIIAIAVWVCALVIWWVCSNAFRHSDMDKLKSRLLGTNKAKKTKTAGQNAALITTEEKGGLLATGFLKRYQLQTKFQEMLEQAGMRWSTHRLVNTCLVACVAGWALAWVLLPP